MELVRKAIAFAAEANGGSCVGAEHITARGLPHQQYHGA